MSGCVWVGAWVGALVRGCLRTCLTHDEVDTSIAPPYKQYSTEGKWSTAPSGKFNTVVFDCHAIPSRCRSYSAIKKPNRLTESCRLHSRAMRCEALSRMIRCTPYLAEHTFQRSAHEHLRGCKARLRWGHTVCRLPRASSPRTCAVVTPVIEATRQVLEPGRCCAQLAMRTVAL